MSREELTAKSFANFMGLDPSNSSCKYFLQDHYATIEAALTALQSEAGRVSVPREPTQAMGIAGAQCLRRDTDEGRHESYGRAIDCWSAMLSAAPAPASQDTPFANCSFRNCDLPGQCRGEGKCHHPAATKGTGEVGVYVENVDDKDAAMAEFGKLVDGAASFSGKLPMLVENGLCIALTGTGPLGMRNAYRIADALNAAPSPDAQSGSPDASGSRK